MSGVLSKAAPFADKMDPAHFDMAAAGLRRVAADLSEAIALIRCEVNPKPVAEEIANRLRKDRDWLHGQADRILKRGAKCREGAL